jgi:hypothetical protein
MTKPREGIAKQFPNIVEAPGIARHCTSPEGAQYSGGDDPATGGNCTAIPDYSGGAGN